MIIIQSSNKKIVSNEYEITKNILYTFLIGLNAVLILMFCSIPNFSFFILK